MALYLIDDPKANQKIKYLWNAFRMILISSMKLRKEDIVNKEFYLVWFNYTEFYTFQGKNLENIDDIGGSDDIGSLWCDNTSDLMKRFSVFHQQFCNSINLCFQFELYVLAS